MMTSEHNWQREKEILLSAISHRLQLHATSFFRILACLDDRVIQNIVVDSEFAYIMKKRSKIDGFQDYRIRNTFKPANPKA